MRTSFSLLQPPANAALVLVTTHLTRTWALSSIPENEDVASAALAIVILELGSTFSQPYVTPSLDSFVASRLPLPVQVLMGVSAYACTLSSLMVTRSDAEQPFLVTVHTIMAEALSLRVTLAFQSDFWSAGIVTKSALRVVHSALSPLVASRVPGVLAFITAMLPQTGIDVAVFSA